MTRARTEAAGINFTVKLAEALDMISIDPDAVQQCLLNLVSNAIDACLACGNDSKPRNIELVTRAAAGGGVEYRVVDNCGGIAEPVQKHIFSEFFSTKGSEGTGLGLMMTRRIVERHGGEVSFTSVPGGGTQFIIRLPEKRVS